MVQWAIKRDGEGSQRENEAKKDEDERKERTSGFEEGWDARK